MQEPNKKQQMLIAIDFVNSYIVNEKVAYHLCQHLINFTLHYQKSDCACAPSALLQCSYESLRLFTATASWGPEPLHTLSGEKLPP